MQKPTNSLFQMALLFGIVFAIFYVMVPQNEEQNVPLNEFSTNRALAHVKKITQKPHYIGSEGHQEVVTYLFDELKQLGLSPQIQEGFTLSDGGILVNSKNVLARIKGTETGKALLLLSHYDSAPHSKSLGASDDASGAAAILESVRTHLHNKQQAKNDIIILFSDAEEIGLNGAALFVSKHPWAKEVGAVINLEARGSAGPGYMLMETNEGNSKMVDAFGSSKLSKPNSNSLMYSIYKMLPNDTDLTVFRTLGKIQGFNFAFIDNHFNYHTAQDSYQNLDQRTMAHQGANLYPLMNYLANSDLTNLNSTQDKVYFSVPFGFISYPFEWIVPMLIIALALTLIIIFIGLSKRVLVPSEIGKGFLKFILALVVSGGFGFFAWRLLLKLYPRYNDIQQGFTYNGHDYIYGFASIALAFCFIIYQTKDTKRKEYNHFIAPLILWLLINAGVALYLKGAAFLIIPVLSGLILLGYFVITQKSNPILNFIVSLPSLVILVPFVEMFPIGLGLKILFVSSVLVVLIFGLLLPILGSFQNKKVYFFLFLALGFCFIGKAHLNADYLENKAKPNSLVYIQNSEEGKAYWATYDKNLDEWTKGYLGEKPTDAQKLNSNKMYSKYKSGFTFMASAPMKNLPKSTVNFIQDSISGSYRNFIIDIVPNRKLNRIDVFSNGGRPEQLKANNVEDIVFKSNIENAKSNKILTYYITDSISLRLQFRIPAKQKLDLSIKESSFDLLEHPQFSITKRKPWMMPTPFVLNDAIIVEHRIFRNAKN